MYDPTAIGQVWRQHPRCILSRVGEITHSCAPFAVRIAYEYVSPPEGENNEGRNARYAKRAIELRAADRARPHVCGVGQASIRPDGCRRLRCTSFRNCATPCIRTPPSTRFASSRPSSARHQRSSLMASMSSPRRLRRRARAGVPLQAARQWAGGGAQGAAAGHDPRRLPRPLPPSQLHARRRVVEGWC